MAIPLLIAAGVAAMAAALRRDRKSADPPGQTVASGLVVSSENNAPGTTMAADDVIVTVDSTPSDESITDRSLDDPGQAPLDFDLDDLDLVVVVESPMGRNMEGKSLPAVEFGSDPIVHGTELAIIGQRGATGEVWKILDSDWDGVGYEYLVSGLRNSDSSVWLTSVELRDMVHRSQANGIRFEIKIPAVQFDPTTQQSPQGNES